MHIIQSLNSCFHLNDRHCIHPRYLFSEPECDLATLISIVLQAELADRVVLVPRENLNHSNFRDNLFQPSCYIDEEVNVQKS